MGCLVKVGSLFCQQPVYCTTFRQCSHEAQSVSSYPPRSRATERGVSFARHSTLAAVPLPHVPCYITDDVASVRVAEMPVVVVNGAAFAPHGVTECVVPGKCSSRMTSPHESETVKAGPCPGWQINTTPHELTCSTKRCR